MINLLVRTGHLAEAVSTSTVASRNLDNVVFIKHHIDYVGAGYDVFVVIVTGEELAAGTDEILTELLKLQIDDGGISEDVDKFVQDYYVIFEYVSFVPAYFILIVLPFFSVALILGSVGKVSEKDEIRVMQGLVMQGSGGLVEVELSELPWPGVGTFYTSI